MTGPLGTAHPCPCGSGAVYAACCEPLHDGAPAVTAEALMRSRYAAYATGRLDHVFRTWHPRTRPADLDPAPGLTVRELRWTGLRVLGTVDGGPQDTQGRVEFEARFETADGPQVLHEDSRFERRAGRWVYVDGLLDVQEVSG